LKKKLSIIIIVIFILIIYTICSHNTLKEKISNEIGYTILNQSNQIISFKLDKITIPENKEKKFDNYVVYDDYNTKIKLVCIEESSDKKGITLIFKIEPHYIIEGGNFLATYKINTHNGNPSTYTLYHLNFLCYDKNKNCNENLMCTTMREPIEGGELIAAYIQSDMLNKVEQPITIKTDSLILIEYVKN
jgi:hypothetical protein